MQSKPDFKNGQIVQYALNANAADEKMIVKGKGKIVGIATVDLPVIGMTYIVEDLSGNFPSEVYPYSAFACFEMWIK